MNIGIVTTWFERGAAYVSKQLKTVLEKEHSVFIFARGGEAYPKGDSNWNGPEVHWGKRFFRDSTEIDLKEFDNWIQKNNIELILFNEQRWWDVLKFCNEKRIPIGGYVDYYTEETIPLFGFYDFLICNTKRHMEAFNWHPGAWYIPWGTDVELFKPQEKENGEANKVEFFHSAGMAPQRKGTEQLLRAFERVKRKAAHLIIHTQADLQEEFPEISEIVDNLQAVNKLEIIQKTVSAPGLYHLGDVYVYPSHLEGIGLTIAEALSCGLPLITVDYPPMNEFVQPDFSTAVPVKRLYARSDGYYWPKNDIDIDALALAVDNYCENKDKLVYFKEQAREYAIKHLNWNKNALMLLVYLHNVYSHESVIKHTARRHLVSYKAKYKRSAKTLVKEYFPSVYRIIRALFKAE